MTGTSRHKIDHGLNIGVKFRYTQKKQDITAWIRNNDMSNKITNLEQVEWPL